MARVRPVRIALGLALTYGLFLALGGLVLGGLEVFVPYYFGGQSHVYGLLLVALVFFAFKPQGLFVRQVRA